MIRKLAIAAALTLSVAAPASAQSVSISLAGKSSSDLQAEIAKAAKTVCARAVVGASFPREMYASCYKHAVADATARLETRMAANGRLASN